MSNALLGTLAFLGCVLTAFCLRRSPGALAGLLIAIVFLTLGCWGHTLWEWSKQSGGAGLPPTVAALPFETSDATRALLIAAIGSTVGACYTAVDPVVRFPREMKPELPDKIARFVLAFSVVFLVLTALGQGPSIWSRQIYGDVDGVDLLLKVTAQPAAFAAIAALIVGAVTSERWVRNASYSLALVWYIALIAGGTRMAVALPVVAAIIVLVKIPRRKWYIPVGRVLLAGSLLMAAIFTFALSLQARTSPHGIVNLADLFQETLQNQGLGGFDPLEAVKQLTASISASYPIIEYSTTRPVGLETLIGNANPLPGTSNDFLLERYEPYLWVPLSMVGESYAQLGWFGQLCLYAAVAAVCGFITNNLAASRFYILSLAGAGIGLMIAALSIQYSSRMFWRVFSIAVVLAIVSLLVRERRPSKELSGQITGASRAKREEPTHAGG